MLKIIGDLAAAEGNLVAWAETKSGHPMLLMPVGELRGRAEVVAEDDEASGTTTISVTGSVPQEPDKVLFKDGQYGPVVVEVTPVEVDHEGDRYNITATIWVEVTTEATANGVPDPFKGRIIK